MSNNNSSYHRSKTIYTFKDEFLNLFSTIILILGWWFTHIKKVVRIARKIALFKGFPSFFHDKGSIEQAPDSSGFLSTIFLVQKNQIVSSGHQPQGPQLLSGLPLFWNGRHPSPSPRRGLIYPLPPLCLAIHNLALHLPPLWPHLSALAEVMNLIMAFFRSQAPLSIIYLVNSLLLNTDPTSLHTQISWVIQ